MYILCGWEGSAHDGKVFNDACSKDLPTFPGKYYLGDAGYALSRLVLTPYRGVRYHLKEWALHDERPQTAKELFNLRHSSLRNAVERIFGVVKKRFPCLDHMSAYPYSTQIKLIMCAVMLHNFIRRNQLYEDVYDVEDPVPDEAAEDNDFAEVDPGVDATTAQQLNAWRDGIAAAMWDEYTNDLLRRV